jgi:hypothetical protein
MEKVRKKDNIMTKPIYENVTYNTLEEIKREISNSDVKNVCNHMAGAGMSCDDLDGLFELINLCLKHDEPWIRNAGFIALYHLNVRFKDKLNSRILVKILGVGLSDNSDIVLGTVNDIIDDLNVFAPEVAKEIINERKGRTQM